MNCFTKHVILYKEHINKNIVEFFVFSRYTYIYRL